MRKQGLRVKVGRYRKRGGNGAKTNKKKEGEI